MISIKMHIGYDNFPNSLKNINDPPDCLFYRGDLSLINSNNIIAIIGSRDCTKEGVLATIEITKILVNAGYVIISGLALGIDTIAHKTTIDNRGKTIAVLGSGLDEKSLYPKQNLSLSKEIVENGLMLSEYPDKTKPHMQHFLKRNRIVVGLSKAIIVTDMRERSGTMMTARLGLKYKRPVFLARNMQNKQLLDYGAIDIENNNDIINLLTDNIKNVN